MGGGKGGKKETQTVRLDPRTQRYVEENRRLAGDLGQQIFNRPGSYFSPFNQVEQGALQGYGDLFGQSQFGAGAGMNLGLGAFGQGVGGFQNTGLNQLGGVAGAIANPQLQGLMPLFEQQANQARLSVDQQATAQGAFGGARAAAAREQAAQGANMNALQTAGNIWGNATGQGLGYLGQRAGQNLQLANLGMGLFGQGQQGLSLGGQFLDRIGGAGATMRGIDQQMRQEDIFRVNQLMGLRQGAIGPYGQTTSSQQPSNKFGSALGGAATGFGIGGPLGAAIGGGAGLLFG